MSDIDWSVELRKIEREFDGFPPEPTRTQISLQKIREITAKQRFNERLAVAGTWTRLELVGALAASLFWWPYGHRCGIPLLTFLFSNAMVVVGGASLAVRGWRERLVWVFSGSALCVVLAWTIVALHVLPRLGYSPAGGTSTAWSCSASVSSLSPRGADEPARARAR